MEKGGGERVGKEREGRGLAKDRYRKEKLSKGQKTIHSW